MVLTNRLLPFLVRRWKDEDVLTGQERVGLVVSTSYGTGREVLVRATEAIARRSAVLATKYGAAVIYAPCSYLFPGAERVEADLKERVFAEYGVKTHRADSMENTVQEARSIASYISQHNLQHGHLLIVTGEMHSRSARWIWTRVMPKSKITVTCVPYTWEYQPDQPVYAQRGPWKWLSANVARQTLLWTPGIGLRIGAIHHRSTG